MGTGTQPESVENRLSRRLEKFDPFRDSRVRRRAWIAPIAVVTLGNCVSLVLLCHYLLQGGTAGGRELIGSGILLWCSNVLLFSLWFWQLDRGGPWRVRPATSGGPIPCSCR